jgi:hemerythrin
MTEYISLVVLFIIAVAVVVLGLMIRSSQKKKGAEEYTATLKAKKRAAKRAELAKSIKKISWSDQFVVDEGVIDKDHQFLFELINKFNQNVPNYQSAAQMVPVLTLLTKYTQTHFQREIKLQKAAAYPYIEDHQKEHNDLIAKYNELIKKAEKANEDNIMDVAAEIGAFLEEWLLNHVVENDLALKPYVDKMREMATSMGKIA